ncbi:PREDICTED: uncharacterized protein LOC104780184 [Camelina sativa]|uniref:Uncharacterized protein LOC104780184 n=1 Tax=Camelina sativa TaxID=90675 RepID=A0ABM0YLV1_CAMSA|nr:PREDICTED: uncharacterized protein LOC104780184 [Camelina sativa]
MAGLDGIDLVVSILGWFRLVQFQRWCRLPFLLLPWPTSSYVSFRVLFGFIMVRSSAVIDCDWWYPVWIVRSLSLLSRSDRDLVLWVLLLPRCKKVALYTTSPYPEESVKNYEWFCLCGL